MFVPGASMISDLNTRGDTGRIQDSRRTAFAELFQGEGGGEHRGGAARGGGGGGNLLPVPPAAEDSHSRPPFHHLPQLNSQ